MLDHMGFRAISRRRAGPIIGRATEYGYYAAFVLDPDGNNVEAGVRE